VLHGVKIPEPPCFLPDLPVDEATASGLGEAGCRPLGSYGSPEEALASAMSEGFFQGPDRPSNMPFWRASVRDYLQAYSSGESHTWLKLSLCSCLHSASSVWKIASTVVSSSLLY